MTMVVKGIFSVLFAACALAGAAWAASDVDVRLTDGWEFAQVWKDTSPASTNKVVRRDLPADSPELVWQRVRVPHDWAIAGPFDPACTNGVTGRLPWVGVGWYRRDLTVPASAKGSFVALRFDGVMARPEVFLNGEKVGGWDYGYLGFEVDVSDKVRFGEKNTLLVRADTSDHKSRWYPGAGIYRDVTLVVEDKEKRMLWNSLKITTSEVTPERAKVRVAYETPKGAVHEEFVIDKPVLWSPDNPHLYSVRIFGKTYRYGVRTIAWTANDGFHLNGKRLQLKGINLHSDLGPLGMAFNRDAMRRQLAIMKEMGVNAFRASHNPPDPQALDLCDEMGFVVWDECFDKWDGTAGIRAGEDQDEYVTRNLRRFVRRDRNHPSIICWSIGNEIPHATVEYPSGSTAARCAAYRAAVLAEDATRPVGIGTNWKNCIETGDYEPLDLTGWNYTGKYAFMKAKYPDKPVVYSESASAFSTYGFYRMPLAPGPRDFEPGILELDSYDRIVAGDTPDAEFARMATDRYCAGDFVWTGIDYLGEPTPNWEGNRSSFFGICDLTGLPKDRYYLYRSVWNEKAHTVHLLPHWNWAGREGSDVPVVCYTDGDEAELFLNGKSLGRRAKRKDLPPVVAKTEPSYYDVNACYRLVWDVPYAPGELKVVAYKGGKPIGEAVRRTAGAAVAIKLTPDRTALKPEELAFVTVELTDDKGVVVPIGSDRISFTLEGAGELVAVGNGSANQMDSFADAASHRLDNGRALVVVRRTGGTAPLKLTASAPGLRPATATFVPAQTVRVDALFETMTRENAMTKENK